MSLSRGASNLFGIAIRLTKRPATTLRQDGRREKGKQSLK